MRRGKAYGQYILPTRISVPRLRVFLYCGSPYQRPVLTRVYGATRKTGMSHLAACCAWGELRYRPTPALCHARH